MRWQRRHSGSVDRPRARPGRSAASASSHARADLVAVVAEDPRQADQLRVRGVGEVRHHCVPGNFGSPASTRCSQVTWFRSWLLKTQKDEPLVVPPLPVASRSSARSCRSSGRRRHRRRRSPAGPGWRTSPRSRTGRRAPSSRASPRARPGSPCCSLSCAREPVRRRAGVGSDDRVLGQHAARARSTTRCGFIGSPSFIKRAPRRCPTSRAIFSSICSRQARSSLRTSSGIERLQRLPRVADELDVGGIADADHAARRCRSRRSAPGPPPAGTPSTGSSCRPSAACRSSSISS